MTSRCACIGAVMACMALAGCGASSDSPERREPGSAPSESRGRPHPRIPDTDASPLELTEIPTPQLGVPRYDTSGTIPQVAGAPHLERVNAALVAMVRRDQREYARRPGVRRGGSSFRGVYETSRPYHVSASTKVVSVVLPLLRLYPGGNDGRGWLSTTLRVPSGDRVALTDLFADPKAGLRALSAATERWIETDPRSQARCVRQSLADRTVGDLERRGLAPRPRNYRDYALTQDGLALAFHQAQFSAPPCSAIAIVVPWATVAPYLGPLGRTLLAGVLRPR